MKRAAVGSVLAWMLTWTAVAHGYEATLDYVDDITHLSDECFIQAIPLKIGSSNEPSGPATELSGTPMDGSLSLADGQHAVRVLRGENSAALWLDLDGAQSLSPVEWTGTMFDGTLLTNVPLHLSYDEDEAAPYRLFLMWHPYLPTVLTYCRNTYRVGTILLEDGDVNLAVIDADSDGRYDRLSMGTLLLDSDGDGRFHVTNDSHEVLALDEPFNLRGITYEVTGLSPSGSHIRIERSAVGVPPKPPLIPGFPAPDFRAIDGEGQVFSLSDLKGRIVVLHFWAGWCPACVSELPYLKTIAASYDEQAVVVVGINSDRTAVAFDDAVGEHELIHRQVFDGPAGDVGALYRVSGIPVNYVIGTDGMILSRGLRREALVSAVADAVASLPQEDDPS